MSSTYVIYDYICDIEYDLNAACDYLSSRFMSHSRKPTEPQATPNSSPGMRGGQHGMLNGVYDDIQHLTDSPQEVQSV